MPAAVRCSTKVHGGIASAITLISTACTSKANTARLPMASTGTLGKDIITLTNMST